MKKLEIPYRLNSMVLDINKDKEITVVSRSEGLELIKGKSDYPGDGVPRTSERRPEHSRVSSGRYLHCWYGTASHEHRGTYGR